MKLTDRQTEELMKELYGKEILPLIKLFKGKKNINEFKIAEKLKLTINQVRNMFYKLQERSLVSFTRKKDKKKGWYVYYWTFNDKEAKNLIISHKQKKLDELNELLAREKEVNYFLCKDKHVRMRYDEAMDNDFRCPECGELLIQEDKERILRAIKKEIDIIEKEIKVKS
ncbi:hypothetical protein HYX17_03195 [Candidatus Woesearchaeota archaeon]|nr:hypothetical protein [Candidatus Woesearchaeota archaeon]